MTAPTMCGSCHAPAVPLELPNGQTRYAYQHLGGCTILQTLLGAARPRDEYEYLWGTPKKYEAADYRG